jgi:hypothetical protein
MDPFARKMLLSAFAFASVMLLMAAVLSVVYFHAHPRCSENVLSALNSPDGRWTAVVMQRRCGDESPFLVHVNLRPAAEPLRLGFFSGEAQEGEIFLGEQQNLNVVPTLSWDSTSQLTIACSDCRPKLVQKNQPRWGPIAVRYEFSMP